MELFDAETYLIDLKTKFLKINPNEYILAYSGGRDSHLLYWFLKVWLPKNDFKMWLEYKNIEIISCNTRMEDVGVLRRMIRNADKVLLPDLFPHEVKEKYGSPLYSKLQDEYLERYQKGSRSKNTMDVIMGNNVWFNLNSHGRKLLLNDLITHKITNKCCKELKEKAVIKYAKENNKKSITGERSSESILRSKKSKMQKKEGKCFNKVGKFTPLHDLTNELLISIENKYNIEIPDIYYISGRTGCMSCLYGKNPKKELDLVSPARRNYLIELFKESYELKGIDYTYKQYNLLYTIDGKE